jgi:hypothetical protein
MPTLEKVVQPLCIRCASLVHNPKGRRGGSHLLTRRTDSEAAGKRRTLDTTEWKGMPPEMLDSHTYEGKVAGTGASLLSGHYHKHLEVSQLVEAHGWEWIRAKVHSRGVFQPHKHESQAGLFAQFAQRPDAQKRCSR